MGNVLKIKMRKVEEERREDTGRGSMGRRKKKRKREYEEGFCIVSV